MSRAYNIAASMYPSLAHLPSFLLAQLHTHPVNYTYTILCCPTRQDNIAPEVIEALQPLLHHPDFQPAKIKKVSQAAFGLCNWVRAMDTYDRVAKVSWCGLTVAGLAHHGTLSPAAGLLVCSGAVFQATDAHAVGWCLLSCLLATSPKCRGVAPLSYLQDRPPSTTITLVLTLPRIVL